MNSVLRSYAIITPSYIRNTIDFLRKLSSVNKFPNNATMDVEALHNNVSYKHVLQAIKCIIVDAKAACFGTRYVSLYSPITISLLEITHTCKSVAQP